MIIMIIILWFISGIDAMFGILSMILICFPIYWKVMHKSKQLRALAAKMIDRRIQLMSEFINGIQVIL